MNIFNLKIFPRETIGLRARIIITYYNEISTYETRMKVIKFYVHKYITYIMETTQAEKNVP